MKKHLLIGVGLILLGLVLSAGILRLRFGGDEDAWQCREGVWVAHGKPAAPMPQTPCALLPSTTEGVACTMEAKLCPDGSSVGRSGPKCEFAPCPASQTVALFFYKPEADTDASGNVLCSAKGLMAVQRTITRSQTPIQDTVNMLLAGDIAQEELSRGITSEFPLEGVSLIGASLTDGILTLSFVDPLNKTSGGACRAGILWAQIEATAKQFEGVREVRFAPSELFQP